MANKRKFEKFYQRHIDKVYRYVFFRVNQNKETAEDLVSEIFIKALDKFDSFDKDKGDSAWIMTITRNHLANHWRDRKPTVSLDQLNDNDQDNDNLSFQQDKTFFSKARSFFQKQQDASELYELLDELDEKDREIVTLHYLSGYNYKEVAKIKEMSVSAVKVSSHRAIKKIRNNMSLRGV
ncbi:MAG: RNA polymerase sigma factor [bacterium]